MELGLKDYFSIANACSGFLALAFFFSFGFASAFALIVLAMAFDYFDGIVARKGNAHNEFGKQLDSLADAVSFGAVPAMLVLLQQNAAIGLNFFVLLLGAVFFLELKSLFNPRFFWG